MTNDTLVFFFLAKVRLNSAMGMSMTIQDSFYLNRGPKPTAKKRNKKRRRWISDAVFLHQFPAAMPPEMLLVWARPRPKSLELF
ncbi:MAG: hypothetical protein JNK47_06365 [Mesorhizobium sp.]|nr:hypothetical protein [Mesorhizobium sp.]MBL8576830.1 hypothetical protein [Mesorhizobium sp.]